MNKIMKNTLILTAITLTAGVLLSFVYEITKEPIAKQEALSKAKAYAEVFPDADNFEVEEDISSAVAYLEEQGFGAYEMNEIAKAYDASGNAVGYVYNVTSPEGYGGDIQFTVGITNDKTILGISFLSISETAGLGMNADTEEWKSQFKGIQADSIVYTKSGKSADNEIDAISSATRTTKAVTNAVNAALCLADYYAE